MAFQNLSKVLFLVSSSALRAETYQSGITSETDKGKNILEGKTKPFLETLAKYFSCGVIVTKSAVGPRCLGTGTNQPQNYIPDPASSRLPSRTAHLSGSGTGTGTGTGSPTGTGCAADKTRAW